MTKIKNPEAYPVKIPIASDYVIGTDSENNGKTVNFEFGSFVDFVNSINGTEIISYIFATTPIQELDENGYGYFLSESNIVNPAFITKLIISKKTKSLVDLTPLFEFINNHSDTFSLKLRNLSDPNNFSYFNIISVTEEEFQFTFSVEITNSDNFLGDFEVSNIYGLEFNNSTSISDTDDLPEGSVNLYFTTARVLSTMLTGISFLSGDQISSSDTILSAFGKIQKQINDTSANLDSKLDKGDYTGNAQDLKNDIDAIYQPDVLVSAVAPTRSVNTFTYPANQYQALINKTLRTNPAAFTTTIGAATTDYKRVDLIYFKSDNTINKIVGTESLTVAIRPDVPTGSVGISFINVFGNVVEDPTPITDEISIQDYNGTEQFRITDYFRFKGVSFDPAAKALVTDPLVPLSAFLDPVNGNDSDASIENASKPFRTMSALVGALPTTNGETYTIYITGGNIDISRLMPTRNLKFVAYMTTNLDFTKVKMDDGVTEATYVIRGNGQCIYTFENDNISIINNFVGIKGFANSNFSAAPSLVGNIINFNWKSSSIYSFIGTILGSSTNLHIRNLYDSPQDTLIFSVTLGNATLIIDNYYTTYKKYICGFGQNLLNITVNNIIETGSPGVNMNIQGNVLNIGNIINFNGVLIAQSYTSLNITGNVSDNCTIDFKRNPIVSGNIKSLQYNTNSYLDGYQLFSNFTGKLTNFLVASSGQIEFQNCSINVYDNLLFKLDESGGIENSCIFKGSNTIFQDNVNSASFPLIRNQNSANTVEIQDYGTTKTNASYYGNNIRYVYKAATFKERLNEVVIRNKIDLVNRVLSSTTTYIIDANLVLLVGESIQVPINGLTLAGYGFDVSSISKNVTGESIFTSPVGNSGNFVSRDIMYSPGTGSVLNLIDSDGSHAIELNDVNFQGVTGSSIGTLNGFRQFTGTTCGFYGLSDGLTLEGNWSGFKLTNSNVIGFGASGALFKKGSSTLFSNRFYIDLNLQIATESKICDFTASNFTNNKSLQIVNCYVKINGAVADNTATPNLLTVTTAAFPNISPYSPKSYFLNNIGIKNTTEVIEDKLLLTLDGVNNVFNIPHGLGVVPKSFQLTFSDGSNTDFIESMRVIDSTKITITCTNTPSAGSITVYYSVST